MAKLLDVLRVRGMRLENARPEKRQPPKGPAPDMGETAWNRKKPGEDEQTPEEIISERVRRGEGWGCPGTSGSSGRRDEGFLLLRRE